jgi:membrane protein
METKGIFQLLKQSFKDFSDDDCPRMAAALSYYTVFALPPLLILILMIVGAFVDPQEATQAIGSNLPGEASNQIGTIVKQANNPAAKSGLSAVLGVFTLLLGATGAFMQLQTALDRAWEVKPDPKAGGHQELHLQARALAGDGAGDRLPPPRLPRAQRHADGGGRRDRTR